MGSGLMAPILPLLLLLYCSFCGGGCCCRLGQRCGAARAAWLWRASAHVSRATAKRLLTSLRCPAPAALAARSPSAACAVLQLVCWEQDLHAARQSTLFCCAVCHFRASCQPVSHVARSAGARHMLQSLALCLPRLFWSRLVCTLLSDRPAAAHGWPRQPCCARLPRVRAAAAATQLAPSRRAATT